MVAASAVIELTGRRTLLMFSGVLSGVSVLSLSIYFFLVLHKCNPENGYISE